MNLLIDTSPLSLWSKVVKHAEDQCFISLDTELEFYLTSLLIRYANKPEVVKEILAVRFLEALKSGENERQASLQNVGDKCLLFTGLFPRIADKRHVKISYFVEIGRTAYASLSNGSNDLFKSLAIEFVLLMDVLQAIRSSSDLLPLEAFDQWNELGSQRALKILQSYTSAIPKKS